MNMKWEIPEARQTYTDEAAQLRANPGEWAALRDVPGGRENMRAQATLRQTADNIKNNRYKAFRNGKFEAATRTVSECGKLVLRLYVRYTGE